MNAQLNKSDRRQLVIKKKEKNADYFYSLGKITYTALVVGIIVSVVQNTSELSFIHILTIVVGIILSFIWYLIANNNLNDE